jgi:LL-diaminopimelate aminotransferase
MKPAQRAQNLPSLFFATLNKRIAQLRAEGADIITLDAGSPDLPPHPRLIDTLKASADIPTHHNYGGYAGQPHFRQAIIDYYARRFGVTLTQAELAPLIGSKEGVVNMHLAWLDPGDVSLIPDPCYPSYYFAPMLAGGRTERFKLLPERGWRPNFADIPTATAREARMLWLNYPNNPTGGTATVEFFAEAVDFCRQYDILLCHDAPYADLTFDGHLAPSVLEVPGAKDIAIEFNSLSKTYNLAGWRIGMAVGNAMAVGALAKVKTQIDSGLPKPVQDMAVEAMLGDQSWLGPRNAVYKERRDMCLDVVRQMGLETSIPKGGFYIWFRVPPPYTSLEYHTLMLEQAHVSLTPGHVYGPNGEGWARISLVAPSDRLQEALNRIRQVNN